jgi:peptidyl-dipeptidase Dcp
VPSALQLAKINEPAAISPPHDLNGNAMQTKPLALLIAASFSVTALAPAAAYSATTVSAAPAAAAFTSNPFYAASSLYLHAPAFDKITNESYLPAFEEGMRQQLAEIDAIANNSAPATFDNTIVAMERSGQLLTRTSTVFFNMTSCNTNDTLDGIQRELSPRLAAHNDAIVLNGKLFARVQSVYDQRETLGLDAESKRLLWR